MAEVVRFHFDPACPWAWQSALWMWEVESVRDVEVEWRLFSLRMINASDDEARARERGSAELRALALARRSGGNDAVARLYRALGESTHDAGEKPSPRILRAALGVAGLPESLAGDALDDESTSEEVRADHEHAVAEIGAFGVPTIVLPSGKGIFGPVVARAPEGEAAGELWDRVRYLVELDGFYELKRSRDRRPGTG